MVLQDFEAAILFAELALLATTEVHPDRAGRLSNLGSELFRRSTNW